MKSPKTFDQLKEEGFLIKEGIIASEVCFLVQPPHIGHPWTEENLIYRSSIWTAGGTLVSPGFKKFFNYTEGSDIIPDPTDDEMVEGSLIAKIDGSLLIISEFNGELIHRTRGTFNAEILPNGHEIEYLKQKYPKVFNNHWIKHDTTLLFEWTTPRNIIVLNYGDEPELRLIGAINHEEYSLVYQHALDTMAKVLNVERPKRYTFNNMQHMIQTIKHVDDEEGVVIYFHDEQDQKKFKGANYLKLHRFKSNATWRNVIDIYIDEGFSTIEEYRSFIIEQFDFECFSFIECFLGPIVSEHMKICSELMGVKRFVDLLVGTQKENALKIIDNYKGTEYQSIAFCYLNGKDVPNRIIKEMILKRVETE